MSERTPQQVLWEARELCKAHGLYLVEVQDKVGEQYLTAYLLYRKNPAGGRGIKIGKRRDPADALRLVKTSAGIKDQAVGEPEASA